MTTIDFNLEWKLKLQNRFINYVKIFSTSDPESETTPSTERPVSYTHLDVYKRQLFGSG